MSNRSSRKMSESNRTAVDCGLHPLRSAAEDSEVWSTTTVIVTTSRQYEICGKSYADVEEEIERIRRSEHPTTVIGMRRVTSVGGSMQFVTVKAVSDPVTDVEEI